MRAARGYAEPLSVLHSLQVCAGAISTFTADTKMWTARASQGCVVKGLIRRADIVFIIDTDLDLDRILIVTPQHTRTGRNRV